MSTRFPVPPGVVGKVVQAAANSEVTIRHLAELVESDAVLSARVLKTVNAPFYGLARRVSSVERAIGLMGIRALRNLVLSLAVREMIPSRDLHGYPLDAFWEDSIRRAAAAHVVARQVGLPHADDLFTLGLCQDLGLLLRLREDPPLAAELGAMIEAGAPARLAVEARHGEPHPEVGAALFASWRFPESFVEIIRHHHDPGAAPDGSRRAARVAAAAERVADLLRAPGEAGAMEAAREALSATGLEDQALGPLLDAVGEQVGAFAEILGLDVTTPPTYEEILARACDGLADLNVSYEQLTRQLSTALEEQQRLARELTRVTCRLEEQAKTDALTGLANRCAFNEAASRELAQARRQGAPLSLLMVDVDHFKWVNDRHGHPAGDAVLKEVAAIMKGSLRAADTVARFGGEEFVALLPFTPRAGAEVAADRMRRAVAGAFIAWEGARISVTVSVGGVTVDPAEGSEPPLPLEVVRRADKALYAAKETGRNRLHWATEDGTEPVSGGERPGPRLAAVS